MWDVGCGMSDVEGEDGDVGRAAAAASVLPASAGSNGLVGSQAGMESTTGMIGKSMAYGHRSVKRFVRILIGDRKSLRGKGLGGG